MSKQETSANIITEIRDLSKSAKYGELLPTVYGKLLDVYLAKLADRLEAAWKREKSAIEADALAVGGLVEASRATAENSSAIGNVAKMREALDYVLHFDATDEAAMEDGLTDAERIAEYADHIKESQKKAEAALAAPPRNCDMPLVVDGPADNNADKAWLVFKHHNPGAYFDVSGLLRCIDWLFAPATEQNGENNGSK